MDAKSKIDKVVDLAWSCINGRVPEVVIAEDRLFIDLGESSSVFLNAVDSSSLGTLLARLQREGLVGDRTTTMWVGVDSKGHFVIWCVLNKK